MSKITDLLNKAKSLLGSKPVNDATDAVKHDRFEDMLYREMLDEAPALRDMRDDLGQTIDHADDLVRDTMMQFWQGEPELRPQSEMRDSHLLNHGVAEDVARSPELEQAKSYTQHDRYGATMAAIGVTSKVREWHKTRGQAMEEAQKEAEEAKKKQQAANDALQQALAAMPGGGQPDPNGAPMPGDDGFTGPLSDEQKQRMDDLANATAQAEAAAQTAEQAQQELQQAAASARQGLQNPVNEATREAKEKLEDEQEVFRAWGVDPGELQKMSFTERQELAQRLQSNRLSKFIDLIGRFKLMQAAQKVRRVEYGRDQVVGTELSGDLSRIVMTEYSSLAMGDDDLAEMLELDFYRRMHEDQLLSRKFEGTEKVGKGAIICCWDESGSMADTYEGVSREAWAKAMAMALLDQARHQKRDFVGIGFSSATQQVVYEFPKGQCSTADLVTMVEHMFNGGTNFERPLDLAVKKLTTEYNEDGKMKGDIVFITDDACGVSTDWMSKFRKAKDRLGFRVFGISIGGDGGGYYREDVLEAISDNVRNVADLTDVQQVRDVFQVV